MLFNLAVLAAAFVQFAATCVANEAFFVTAIVTDAQNNSALECWQLNASVSVSAVGTTVPLGNLANATYAIFPPNFYPSVHTAPHPQWVVFTSGLAVITLPNNTGSAYVLGGSDGIIIAVDTVGTGHNTSYPLDSDTTALLIPFEDGVIPAHSVVADGPCSGNQVQNVTTAE